MTKWTWNHISLISLVAFLLILGPACSGGGGNDTSANAETEQIAGEVEEGAAGPAQLVQEPVPLVVRRRRERRGLGPRRRAIRPSSVSGKTIVVFGTR